MKTICIALLCFFPAFYSLGQDVKIIKFVYMGEELKPHGSLLISLGKTIMPTDKELDWMYGSGIQTDDKTFEFIISQMKASPLLRRKPTNPIEGEYEISQPGKRKRFVYGKNFDKFFHDLAQTLIKNNLDPKLIKAFSSWHSEWGR